MAIAGHVSWQMLEHYAHIRLDLERKALDALATRLNNSQCKATRYDPNYDTRQAPVGVEPYLGYTKEWSGREDLNLRPPGPEPNSGIY